MQWLLVRAIRSYSGKKTKGNGRPKLGVESQSSTPWKTLHKQCYLEATCTYNVVIKIVILNLKQFIDYFCQGILVSRFVKILSISLLITLLDYFLILLMFRSVWSLVTASKLPKLLLWSVEFWLQLKMPLNQFSLKEQHSVDWPTQEGTKSATKYW